MAAIQCQYPRQCNNKTTDPSGLCHLHRSTGGTGVAVYKSGSPFSTAPTSALAPSRELHPLPQLKGGTVVTQVGYGIDLMEVKRKDEDGYDTEAIYDLSSGKAVLGSQYERDGDSRVSFMLYNESHTIKRSDHGSDEEYHDAVRAKFDEMIDELEEGYISTSLPDDLVAD